MLKLLSWVSSFLTVGTLFCGFWSLCYIQVNCSWGGVMIALGLAFFFWLGTAFFYLLCDWSAWKDKENERARHSVQQYKKRCKGGDNDVA